MDRTSRRHGWLLFLVLSVTAFIPGCDWLNARDQLNKGVQAYKDGKFDVAIERFKQAKALDPHLLNARLYLATAYASQYIPGAPSEDNVRMGQQAIQEFQEILQTDPKNLVAIDGLGSIVYNMATTPFDLNKLNESKSYHEKHIQIRPEDPEPYYWIGVIDWSITFHTNAQLRSEYNAKTNPRKQVKIEDPLPPAVRDQFASAYGKTVDEGIDALKKAIELRPDYDDAMAYLNLLYRQKADMVSSPDERDNFQRLADELVDKVKAIKQQKMEHPAPNQPSS